LNRFNILINSPDPRLTLGPSLDSIYNQGVVRFRALRKEMRKGWDLPAESLFKHSRPD
jgi:hypothetical protein